MRMSRIISKHRRIYDAYTLRADVCYTNIYMHIYMYYMRYAPPQATLHYGLLYTCITYVRYVPDRRKHRRILRIIT
jgi:hypothetical protein